MNPNLQRLLRYENKKYAFEALGADYPRPLFGEKLYAEWKQKYHNFRVEKLSWKILIP